MAEKYVCFSINVSVSYDDECKTEEDAINEALADMNFAEWNADNVEVFERGDC